MAHKRSLRAESAQVGEHVRRKIKHDKRRHKRLFRLEDLPTEILEMIFEYSGNLNLPLVSSVLIRQLSGARLQDCLMTQILTPILLDLHSQPSAAQLARMEDLLSRRFCTWAVFGGWLKANALSYRGEVPLSTPLLRGVPYPRFSITGSSSYIQRKLQQEALTRALSTDTLVLCDHKADIVKAVQAEHWQAVVRLLLQDRITTPFALPGKLLHGPWTADRIAFLKCLQHWIITSLFLDTEHGARVASFGGIVDAIKEGQPGVIELLYTFGAEPDGDALRHAVVDVGCTDRVIDVLLACHRQSRYRRWAAGVKVEPFNALDPSLWDWAEQRKQVLSGRGQYLKHKLSEYAEECLRCDQLAAKGRRPRDFP